MSIYIKDYVVVFPILRLDIAFSDARLAMADSSGAPLLSGSMLVSETFNGSETDWSRLYFEDNISSEVGDLFAVIHFPSNAEGGEPGTGPGIGYRQAESSGDDAWISSDGQTWTRIQTSVDVCLDPIYSTNKSGATRVFSAPVTPRYTTDLSKPYPNPFNPSTTLEFTLAKKGEVSLKIYNVRGELVKVLVDEVFEAGAHDVVWNGRDRKDRSVASGVYLVQMKADSRVKTERMVLVR